MPFCSFADGAGMYDVTPIENMFLLEYLPTAPEEFLRVYLYARMLSLHPELCDGMDDMARALHMDPDAVYNAMTYWERQGLVKRLTDRPPTYAMLPVMHSAGCSINPMETEYYEYRDFNANLQAIFGSELLQPKQYAMANDWINILGFTQEAVLKMVEVKYRHSRARKPYSFFKNLNETVVQWADRGIRTLEDVERALETDGQVEKIATALMKQFSMHRQATVDELKLVSKWLNRWGFSEEQIIEACAETTKSRTPTLSYLNSILDGRRKGSGAGFDEVKDVLRELGESITPTPAMREAYGKMLADGFEPETVRLAAVQCARKKKHKFDDLQWMLDEWGKKGLHAFAEADAYIRDMSRLRDELKELLSRSGIKGVTLNEGHISLYAEWECDFPKELIALAAECAKGKREPISYIDKVLADWRKRGVDTADKARSCMEARPAASGAQTPNPALNYAQRSNTESDYDGLFINLNAENGGDQA